MINNISSSIRIYIAFMLVITALTWAGCNSAQQPDSPAESAETKFTADILGKREWKPSEEHTLTCAVQDPQDGELTYAWSAEKGSIRGTGQTVTWAAPDTLGDYNVTVTVTSSKSGQTRASKQFKVTDDPYHNETPDKTVYLNLTIPSSETVSTTGRLRTLTTGEVQCVVEGADPADLSYRWTAPAGKLLGEDIDSGKDSRIGWIAPGQGGQYTISVVVTDKSGRQASGEVIIEVICCRDP